MCSGSPSVTAIRQKNGANLKNTILDDSEAFSNSASFDRDEDIAGTSNECSDIALARRLIENLEKADGEFRHDFSKVSKTMEMIDTTIDTTY